MHELLKGLVIARDKSHSQWCKSRSCKCDVFCDGMHGSVCSSDAQALCCCAYASPLAPLLAQTDHGSTENLRHLLASLLAPYPWPVLSWHNTLGLYLLTYPGAHLKSPMLLHIKARLACFLHYQRNAKQRAHAPQALQPAPAHAPCSGTCSLTFPAQRPHRLHYSGSLCSSKS